VIFLLYSDRATSEKMKFYWLIEEIITSIGHQVTINETLNFDAVIFYGEITLSFTKIFKAYPILNIPLETMNRGPIKTVDTKYGEVVFFESIKADKVSHLSENVTYLSFDLINFLFYYLSEEEYYHNHQRDNYSRLTFELSQKSISEIEQPIVNMWGKWIDKWLIDSLLNIDKPYFKKCHWPNQAEIAISFSHDVDIVNKDFFNYWRTFVFYLINRETTIKNFIFVFVRHIYLIVIKGKSIYNNYQFNRIKKFHKKNKIRATFNIISSKAGLLDNKNYLELAKNDIKELIEEGHEIGLHGGFESKSYSIENTFIQEKKMLVKEIGYEVLSSRQHYLGFDINKTFLIQEKAGIEVDTSVGYPDVAGFKSGYTHPYHPWLIKKKRKSNLYELPLILMDGTLMSKTYSNLSLSDAKKRFIFFFKIIKKYNGVLTVNWHQRIFSEGPYSDWMKLYYFIVRKANKNITYKATVKEIVSRYETIKSLQLFINKGFIHIQSHTNIISFSFILHLPYRLSKNQNNNVFLEVMKEGYSVIEIPEIKANEIILLPFYKLYENG